MGAKTIELLKGEPESPGYLAFRSEPDFRRSPDESRQMKTRMIMAAVLACVCVTVAWIVQFRYGIGSCGPASNTPALCLAFGMGPFYLLVGVHPFGAVLDAMPNWVGVGVMFLLPLVLWFGLFLGVQALGGFLWGRWCGRTGK